MTLCTKTEVADAMNVSDRTITRWVAKDLIPFHKIGSGNGNGSIRFNIEEVLNATREEKR